MTTNGTDLHMPQSHQSENSVPQVSLNSMRRLLATAVAGCLLGYSACSPDVPKAVIWKKYLKDLSRFVKENDEQLLSYAEAVRKGELQKRSGRVDYPPPALSDQRFRVFQVTKDANENVYFILDDSFTTFNVGFISRKLDRPFLGDQIEPTLVTNILLHGAWYYFKAQ